MKACKTCGHPLPEDEIAFMLGPIGKRLYEAVKRSGRAGIDTQRLMGAVYNNADGGPLQPNRLFVLRHDLNRKLAAHGIKIISSRHGPGASWRLEAIKP